MEMIMTLLTSLRTVSLAATAALLGAALAAQGFASIASAQTASECPIAGHHLWHQFDGCLQRRARSICLFLRIEGAIADLSIVQRLAYGVLRQLNTSTFEYTANANYAGPDTFSVQVTGKGTDGFRHVDHPG
jgi:hypothetical protein